MTVENITPIDAQASRGDALHCPPNPARLRQFATSPFLHVALLVAIVFYCFGRTLGSYFLADDFGEIRYVDRIFNGELNLLWSNFTGNYMQIPSMNVYRPMLLMSLVFDYLIWRADAFGYYLTNVLYFTGDSILIYALIRRLTPSWTEARSALTAFFSAALFASYPLHCESVSWVVGRVDIACCFYYLLSLYLLARSLSSSNRLWLAGSIASFWLGVTTKEMAIGLPVMAAAIGFFLQPRSTPGSAGFQPASSSDTLSVPAKMPALPGAASTYGIANRLKSAFAISWPFWLCTAIYFALRYITLGTLTGGYTGGIGATQLGAVVQKWTDMDTLRRLNFPLNYSVFHDTGIYPRLLSALYFVPAITLCIRLLGRAIPWSWVFFCGVWMMSAAAPIYQLWGLGYNLDGSRFFFFLSVPICVLTAVLAFAPGGPTTHLPSRLTERMTVINAITFTLLVLLFCRITYLNNVPWVHAGKTVRSVQAQARKLVDTLPANKQAIVLGIPKDEGGAHMILNGATFSMMLSEPFIKGDGANRLLTFDPIMFGDPDIVNTARIKQSLADPNTAGMYVWDQDHCQFKRITLEGGAPRAGEQPENAITGTVSSGSNRWMPSTAGGAVFRSSNGSTVINKPAAGDGITLSGLNLNPLHADYIELNLRYKSDAEAGEVSASWHGKNADGKTSSVKAPPSNGSSPVRLFLPVSRYWRWYSAGTIESITLSLKGFRSVEIAGARLLSEDRVAPSLTISGAACSPRGVYEAATDRAQLQYDGSAVDDAASIRVEISKPNFFFEHFTGPNEHDAVLSDIAVAGKSGQKALNTADLKQHGYYQLRLRCFDSNGAAVGDYSDPVTMSF